VRTHHRLATPRPIATRPHLTLSARKAMALFVALVLTIAPVGLLAMAVVS